MNEWHVNRKGNRPPHGKKVLIEGTIIAHNWGETIAFCKMVNYEVPELCWFDDCECTDDSECNCDPIWDYDVHNWKYIDENE